MTIQEMAEKFHWIKIAEDGVIELYLDHHSLSTFRMCQERFNLEIIKSIRPKGNAWFLDFGIMFHDMIEEFYKRKTDNSFELVDWLSYGKILWDQYKIDDHKENKTYKTLGGFPGFCALLAQYQQFYAAELSNMRVVGTEIAFGKGREVFIGEFTLPWSISNVEWRVRCYLAGRIDLLMDDGTNISPMDHKTASFFKDDLSKMYDPQEGMTGYVYATKHILKNLYPDLQRQCNKIWMNFIQVTPTKESAPIHERFKRIPLFKTDFQLENWRKRQLTTFESIFTMLSKDLTPDWNTMVCNNYFHNKCSYRDLHRQNSQSGMDLYLSNDFIQVEPWNPNREEDLKEDVR